MSDNLSNKEYPMKGSSTANTEEKQVSSSQYMKNRTRLTRNRESISKLSNQPGVFTLNHLLSSGFKYTGVGDTTRCDECGLEVSHWTTEMKPFIIHRQQKPDCPFVRSTTTTATHHTLTSNERQSPIERQITQTIDSGSSSNTLLETDKLQQVRKRTFSHWPHRTIPSSAQMIEAGFFSCNVGDRVICIYCNLVCHQWTPYVDDPCDVHKTLSPNCIYVKAKLTSHKLRPIINEYQNRSEPATGSPSFVPANRNSLEISKFVLPLAQNSNGSTNSNDQFLPIDNSIQANYFNTDVKSRGTCTFCDRVLQKGGPNDNPMIEHARLFPDCPYVMQLNAIEFYRRPQEKQKTDIANTSNGNIQRVDMLSRLVAARLDLPISQRLLRQNFQLSIIRRCWEDQLRVKEEDFATDTDLYVACLILQKQIEHINGKKENIVIPSERMTQSRENATREQAVILAQRRETAGLTSSNSTRSTSTTTSNNTAVGITALDNENHHRTRTIDEITGGASINNPAADTTANDPCVVCLLEIKRLACIPCGHLATCVPCGHSLRSCPICRTKIEAFVRIHI